MPTKQIIAVGLVMSGAVAGFVGAVLIEPVVIGAGAFIAAIGAAMRFADRRATAQRI